MQRICPRERAGLSMLAASTAPDRPTGAEEHVQLVDEDDDVAVLDDLGDDALQALLEVAAVLRAGDHPGQVELRPGARRAARPGRPC